MNRSFRGSASFLAIPFTSYFSKGANVTNSRAMTTIPPTEPGTLGSIVVTVAEKLGIGE